MVKVVAPIQFDADVTLYRSAADTLRTDDAFSVGGRTVITPGGAGGDIIFQGDTNLYRSGVGQLKTDGSFFAQNIVTADRLYIGAAQDAQFLRWGPGQIRLYDASQVAALALKDIYVDVAGTGGKAYFGASLDTNLYREAADLLRTDDSFHLGPGGVLCLNNGASGIAQIEFAYNGSNRQYRSYISTTAHGGVSDGNLMDFYIWKLADGVNGLGSALTLRLRGIGIAQAPGGVATRVKAGTPTDADWESAPPDGTLVVDTTSKALWFRSAGAWARIAGT